LIKKKYHGKFLNLNWQNSRWKFIPKTKYNQTDASCTKCVVGLCVYPLASEVAKGYSNATIKNEHICSMCIKINKVGKQEVGIWWVQKHFRRYGVPIWSLWPNINIIKKSDTSIFDYTVEYYILHVHHLQTTSDIQHYLGSLSKYS
jgi:hypothetical protein